MSQPINKVQEVEAAALAQRVKSKVAAPTVSETTPAVFIRDDPLTKIVEAVKKAAGRFEVVVFLVLAIFLIYDENTLENALTHWQPSPRSQPLKSWLLNNLDHTLAFVLALPVFFSASAAKRSSFCLGFIVVWCFFPTLPLFLWAVVLGFTLIYFQLSDGGARLILVVSTVAILILTGNFSIDPFHGNTIPGATTTARTAPTVAKNPASRG